jgi:hypothetical protein
MAARDLTDLELRDPVQGFDCTVEVVSIGTDDVLTGSFTGFMCKIINQTEAYLPLGTRVPRMLDGEILIAWSLEQGLQHPRVLANTYGKAFAEAYGSAKSRQTPVPRQRRFNIKMNTTVLHMPADSTSWSEVTYNPGDLKKQYSKLELTLRYCKVDTGSFGVMAGRRVAASSWQGSGEGISCSVT